MRGKTTPPLHILRPEPVFFLTLVVVAACWLDVYNDVVHVGNLAAHGIFHLFCLAGTVLQFLGICGYVL